jgi:glycosyltransferase involved in cell wall biosynthesis
MTAYNREKYIEEAMQSVLAQSYDNLELIIVDDCSSDKTVSIVREYAEKDTRIKLYLNEANLGDYPNRNRAASLAKGEILMYVDSDDTINSDAVEYVVTCFHQYPSCSFATIYKNNSENNKNCSSITSFDAINQHFFEKPFLYIGPGGTAVKKEFFFTIGQFPERYGPANDMFYNVKAASNSPIILMNYNYLFYREHAEQENKNHFSYLYNNYLYMKDLMILPELPLSQNQKEYLILKNKRRFSLNIIKFIIHERDINKAYQAIHLARFTLRDFLKGIFH